MPPTTHKDLWGTRASKDPQHPRALVIGDKWRQDCTVITLLSRGGVVHHFHRLWQIFRHDDL